MTDIPARSSPLFDQTCFVMVKPSHPGNVGSAARAIKTMGFGQLTLVSPAQNGISTQPEAQTLASGATDVLAHARYCDSLEQALAGSTLAFALTARPRDLGPTVCDIRQAAHTSLAHLQRYPNGRVAIVLGTERSGLTNSDIAQCQYICHIPANPQYSSLNIAQALQLAAWELRYAYAGHSGQSLIPHTSKQSIPAGALPASNDKIRALLAHWEEAMIATQFLDPAHPKKLMPRMQHLFTRATMSNDEVDMMRGVCTAILRHATRLQ